MSYFKRLFLGDSVKTSGKASFKSLRESEPTPEEPTGNATIYFNMIQDLNSSSNLKSFLFMQQSFQAAQGDSCDWNGQEITTDTLSITESGNLVLCNGNANGCYFSYDTSGTIYLNSGETFTVNYTITKQSSTTPDRVIANIIKVVLNPNIITFTIHSRGSYGEWVESYQAYEGMTWGEWVESEFNTGGYSVNSYDNSIDVWTGYTGGVNNVTSSSVIKANTTYTAWNTTDVT